MEEKPEHPHKGSAGDWHGMEKEEIIRQALSAITAVI